MPNEDRSITAEFAFDAPPEKVWRALTEPELIECWLMPNDFAPEQGRQFTFRTHPAPGFDGVIRCRVTTVEVPHSLAYTWLSGPADTLVTWTLSAVGAGSHLLLLHDGFDPKDHDIRELLAGGWRDRSGPLLKEVVATL